MSPTRYYRQLVAATLIVGLTLLAIAAVGIAATPDWRLW